MNKKISAFVIVSCLYFESGIFAQKQTLKTDLSALNNFRPVNREMTVLSNDTYKIVVHLNSKPGFGVAWCKNVKFERGVIKFDVKGKNVFQQSFVGIAFHGINDSTFEAVYFRPFNFQSQDTTRKNHSVQYISLPQYDWFVLREKFPGKYENKLTVSPDPEKWFHVRIIVTNKISVYVNADSKPSLVVKPLSDRTTGNIGLWVGNNSDGDFANLGIQKNQ